MNFASLPLRGLTATLLALFATDNLLLLSFLGLPPSAMAMLILIFPTVLAIFVWKVMPCEPRVSIWTVMLCFAVSATLLMLGGEGRLLYATPDWQIRDAVLADMGNHRWPFDYWLDGRAQLLRAPLGMYLMPALLGGASQLGRDWALLAHNSLIFSLLLSQGAALFTSRRTRLVALIIFLMFSGLDVLGNLVHQWAAGSADWNHIERWAGNYQYSSHITQLFWVPQHAFAGWAVALTYTLWRKNLAPVGIFAASIPLVALWSPFALFGALPFAMFAAVRALKIGGWTWLELVMCLVAALLSLPSLLYLSAGAASVGGGFLAPNGVAYVLFLLLETLSFSWLLLRDRTKKVDRLTVLIASTCLILMPLWTIGANNDFQMRASIMPLALMAIALAEWAGRVERREEKTWLLILVTLGSVTGTVEIARSLRLAPSPEPRCSLAGVWHRQTGFVVPYASYYAPLQAFPFPIRPSDRVSGLQPASCWDRPWNVARSTNAKQGEQP